MRIRFLSSISSADGWSHPPGKVVDFPDDELAAKFVASGIAVPVIDELAIAPKILETAVPSAPENTSRRTSKKR